MLQRDRVYAALDHHEPDRIPWGEHLIDFNIYEAVLGRQSYVNSHFTMFSVKQRCARSLHLPALADIAEACAGRAPPSTNGISRRSRAFAA